MKTDNPETNLNDPLWRANGIFPDEENDIAFDDKFESLLCECHQRFDPLNQILWTQADPTTEEYPITLSGCQRNIREGILMHAFFRLMTPSLAEQLPDFRHLHLLREMEQEMLAQYLMDLGTLTDALHYCNVGFDTLSLAMKAYEKSHQQPMELLPLSLIQDTLPRFFYRHFDASLCDRLLDSLEYTGEWYRDDYITCPGLGEFVPGFLQEMRHVVNEVIQDLNEEA